MPTTEHERQVLNNFKTNIKSILHAQNLSEDELSLRAGFEDRGALSALMQGNSLPDMLVPLRLADALGIPMEALFRVTNAHLVPDFEALPVGQVDHEAARLLCAIFKSTEKIVGNVTDRPTLDSIISWWKESDGDLSASDQISPHFDLVRAADTLSCIPTVDHVGALGLSAATLGSSEKAGLEMFIKSLNMSDLEELNRNIRTVARTGIGMVTPQTRTVSIAATNETLSVSFVRLMLPVKDMSGTQFVLNYSTLLSESTPRKLDG